MSEPINLDAARAARREKSKKEPKVVFGKKTFVLPVEIPFAAVEQLGKLDVSDPSTSSQVISRFIEILFGDQYEAFTKLQPSTEDIEYLMEALAKAYGFESPGESQASVDS